MRRILFSRAALFPWLGLALLAVGSALPGDSTAGLVVVVIGANVAFYSLRDFSANFSWAEDEARPMLRLCGLAFLLGLALAAAATQFEPLNRWLAFLCAGLYLCLFTVWTIQPLVSGAYRALSFVGLLLMFGGAVVGFLGWQDWRLFAESEATPREITLDDLLRNGPGPNRHVLLKGFRFCDAEVADKSSKGSKINEVWIPVVPAEGPPARKPGPAPAVPPRVTAVAIQLSMGTLPAPPGRPPLDARTRQRQEELGCDCTVATGIKKLPPEVRQKLSELAPDTDFESLLVLDWRKPGSADRVYGLLIGGGGGLLIGLLLIGGVYVKAWRAILAPEPPEAEPGPDEWAQT